MNHYPIKVIAGVISSIFLVNSCVAADNRNADIQAQYLRDRAACLDGTSNQSKAACLQEAGAAKQAALAGKLTSIDADQLQRNRERRCEVHTGADREDCLLRMRGEGTQSGSAQQGGIFRELTVTVPVTSAEQSTQ